MTPSTPPGLRTFVATYDGQRQPPVTFISRSWTQALTTWPAEAEILDDGRWTQRVVTPGRRCVRRQDLTRLAEQTDLTDDLAVRRAFLLVMAWGSGTSNPRSYRNVQAALASPRCADRLAQAASACRKGDLVSAYAAFSLPGVGRSFFTKWFAFAGCTPGREWQPLILDDRVLRTLNDTFGLSTRTLAGSRNWGERYSAYVRHLHTWSRILLDEGVACTAERLEWIFFRHNGGPLANDAGQGRN